MASGFPNLPVSQIVNVQWGAGIFVVGDFDGQTRYASATKLDEWHNLGRQSFTAYGAILASSYANVGEDTEAGEQGEPTYVIGGTTGFDPSNPDDAPLGIIMVSRDGKTWRDALSYDNKGWASNKEANVLAIVWHKATKAFYASVDGFMGSGAPPSGDPLDGTQWWEQVLFKSLDGKTWAQIDYAMIEAADLDTHTPLITPYLHTEVKDHLNQGVGDGVFGYYETDSKNVQIAPQEPLVIRYGQASISDDGVATSNVIITKTEDGTKTTATKNVGFLVSNVAYTGGSWIAAGGGSVPKIAASTDDGDTWRTVFTNSNPFAISTAIAGAQRAATA